MRITTANVENLLNNLDQISELISELNEVLSDAIMVSPHGEAGRQYAEIKRHTREGLVLHGVVVAANVVGLGDVIDALNDLESAAESWLDTADDPDAREDHQDARQELDDAISELAALGVTLR